MSPTIDAYAAGLIDGEGCIGVSKSKGGTYAARIDVGMSSKARILLERLQRAYGGSIRNSRPGTDRWESAECWMVSGTVAAATLRRIAAHLVLKSEQASIALKVEEIRAGLAKTPTGRSRWTDEAKSRCAILKTRMHELNRKGPAIPQLMSGSPIARIVAGQWVTDQGDLFSDLGWAQFCGPWPKSGTWDLGNAYGPPTSEHPIAVNVSSSSPVLPTPKASDSGTSGRRAGAGFRPPLSQVVLDGTD